jgi:hypothetical protein
MWCDNSSPCRPPSCSQMRAIAVGLLLLALASCEVANATPQLVKGTGTLQQVLGGRKLLQMAVFSNPTVTSGGAKYPLCSCMKDHTSLDEEAYECTDNRAAALAWYWAEGECAVGYALHMQQLQHLCTACSCSCTLCTCSKQTPICTCDHASCACTPASSCPVSTVGVPNTHCLVSVAACCLHSFPAGRDNQLVFEPTTKVTGTINTEPVQCYDGETLRCMAAFTGLQMAINKPRCTPNPNGQGVSCVGRHK